MRSVLACILALLVAPVCIAVEDDEPAGRLAVSLVQVDEKAVIVVWSPAPGALSYDIYRGHSAQTATMIAQSATTAYVDQAPLPGDVWYIIRSNQATDTGGSYGGSCVDHHGTTGVSVTTSQCV